jgi:hypothetical protein
MSRYFTNFPIVEYQRKLVRNVTQRSKIRDGILQDPYVFLPYTVREGEKPETVAQLYYGSVDDTWLVLLANNITDPYYQWPMDDEEFNEYFVDKYSQISGRTKADVVRWGLNTTINDNIIYWYKTLDDSDIVRVSPESFRTLFLRKEDGDYILSENGRRIIASQIVEEGWKSVRAYEYEKQQNENKREILLIDRIYRNQVVEEFRRSLRTP